MIPQKASNINHNSHFYQTWIMLSTFISTIIGVFLTMDGENMGENYF